MTDTYFPALMSPSRPRPVRFKPAPFAAALLLVLAPAVAAARDVAGSGASFVLPVMTQWADAYAAAGRGRVRYRSIGSEAGVAEVLAGRVDFATTDAPLAAAELARHGVAQFPLVIGGIVPVVNLHGIGAGQLRLDGPVLAGIYLGKIRRWNDPAIAALNPTLSLPATRIRVVRRADGSGSTLHFSHYLAQVSEQWAEDVGFGTTVAFPVGLEGSGNEGVAAIVRQLPGAIGYVELSHATASGLAYAALRNADGQWVQPSLASFKAAASSIDWADAPGFDVLITNADGPRSWPIAAMNVALVPTAPSDPTATRATLSFFRWTHEHGDGMAEALGYVPLSLPLTERIQRYWASAFAPDAPLGGHQGGARRERLPPDPIHPTE